MALNYYINQKGEIPNTALSLTDGGRWSGPAVFIRRFQVMRRRPWFLWTIWPKSWAWRRCW